MWVLMPYNWYHYVSLLLRPFAIARFYQRKKRPTMWVWKDLVAKPLEHQSSYFATPESSCARYLSHVCPRSATKMTPHKRFLTFDMYVYKTSPRHNLFRPAWYALCMLSSDRIIRFLNDVDKGTSAHFHTSPNGSAHNLILLIFDIYRLLLLSDVLDHGVPLTPTHTTRQCDHSKSDRERLHDALKAETHLACT